MEKNPEHPLSDPPLEPWMDEQKVEFRKKARHYLDAASALGLLPGTTIESASVFPRSINSVVFKVQSEAGVHVVKMKKMREGSDPLAAEAAFFRVWNGHGVATPDVISTYPGSEELPAIFLVMKLVEHPVLSDSIADEPHKQRIYEEMGKMLALMHRAKGSGFGEPRLGDQLQGRHATLSDEVHEYLDPSVPSLIRDGFIAEADKNAIDRAIAILEADLAQNQTSPALTHNDFGTNNIFSGTPLTVFDPMPRVTHSAIDLASALARARFSYPEADHSKYDSVLAGYRSVASVDEQIIHAGSVIAVINKLRRKVRKNQLDKVGILQGILRDSREGIGY